MSFKPHSSKEGSKVFMCVIHIWFPRSWAEFETFFKCVLSEGLLSLLLLLLLFDAVLQEEDNDIR